MMKERISVRDLVAFSLTDGSLGSTVLTSTRAVIGTKEHKRIQDSRPEGYLKEYSMKTISERNGVSLEVYGRADGIFKDSNPPIIEEIKTTTNNIISEKHLAQVKIYAYLYLIENKLKGIEFDILGIRLLYINIDTSEERIIEQNLTALELEDYFNELISKYLDYLIETKIWAEKRDQSLNELKFPFDNFREGQRDFSISVYRAVRDGETLFGRAPTGTGKSVATLFPALKSMGEGGCSKIFYLTAKTVGRITARDTLNLLREKGALIRSVVLTAKEKMCINSEFNCSPDICPYADDYFKKLNPVIDNMLEYSDFHEENLKSVGRESLLCPFELSLDISNHCDVIICDYNYVFDLRVQLKRYFEGGKKDYSLLIDEAHNLPDRLRGSYSCEIVREDVPPLIGIVKGISDKVLKSLEEINETLIGFSKEYKKSHYVFETIPEDFIKKLRSFTKYVENSMINEEFKGKKLLLDWYFNALFFIKLSELFSDGHIFLLLNQGGLGVKVKILCNDPSYLFSRMLEKSKSHIFFSATLTPLNYYKTLLLNDIDFKHIDIPSPYVLEHLNLIIRSDIKTTYRERNRYYQEIADSIVEASEVKEGNYIAFFPSYSFMEEVRKLVDKPVHIQKNNMGESERKKYIDAFHNKSNILSFAIMGGVFGEGIDLVGDKLIGVIVVGVGLPQISIEGDLVKKYFESKGLNGYNYSYTFPGFNKVMQAVGRVIRREEDRGIAVLIDARFNTPLYRKLFPYEWRHFQVSGTLEDMKSRLVDFWRGTTD